MINFSYAQESQPNNGMGFGFQICQYQKDFGLGLNLMSPSFFYNRISVRVRSNLVFNERVVGIIPINSPVYEETVWTPYANISLGMVGITGFIHDKIRLYSEGGLIAIIPSKLITSKDVIIGGYGLFGVEFFMDNLTNYFIEIGAVGTGAVADMVIRRPIYSNGLLINTGFRFQLK
ncbi:MAG: hypothetical protein NW207_05005 [Cytophagales bacterium]|nr:hypothetical protein [Cytophagales bacterium]